MATLRIAADPPLAGHPPARSIRRLRVTVWALQRMLRTPTCLPRAWRTVRFSTRLDRVRSQLLPIRSLAALADSYTREHGTDDTVVRLAYGLRWLELSGVLDERPWRLHCTPPPR